MNYLMKMIIIYNYATQQMECINLSIPDEFGPFHKQEAIGLKSWKTESSLCKTLSIFSIKA